MKLQNNNVSSSICIRIPLDVKKDFQQFVKIKHGIGLNDFFLRAAKREIERLKQIEPVV